MTRQNTKPARRKRDKAFSRFLLLMAGIVLVMGLFAQITMLARISSQNKQASELEGEIEELSANVENLELYINQYHNLKSIELRAQQLGMERPDETQIRVVSVVRSNVEDTSIQAAENIGAESIPN